jgi:DNA-binding NarL/FixJ family response regulator
MPKIKSRRNVEDALPPAFDSPEAKLYRVQIADDHFVVRYGLRLLLEAQPGIEVAWETSTGPETISCADKEKPDLLILGLTLPEKNGLEVLKEVRVLSPETDVMVLTMHFSEELAKDVLRNGALAYVLKSDVDSELLAAVDQVRHRQPFFTGRLTVSMVNSFLHMNTDAEASRLKGDSETGLTARETEVIQLLAGGKSNKEVATALKVSTRTIESHRNHIMHKMNFTSFSDLVRYAIRHRLVEP